MQLRYTTSVDAIARRNAVTMTKIERAATRPSRKWMLHTTTGGRCVGAGGRVGGGGWEVYLVENAQLRLIPSLDTFFALNLSLSNVIQLGNREFDQIPKGDNMPYLDWAGEGK